MIITKNYRDVDCGSLRIEDVGKTIRLAGWIDAIRKLGGITFITLRDQYGITQLVIDESLVQNLNKEDVVSVLGKVVERSSKNPNMPTGDIEIEVDKISILGKCDNELPFEIKSSQAVNEDLRLKYRYLDLRAEYNQKMLKLRSDLMFYVRTYFHKLGFTEVQTPILTASSPEGARDFLVPSRLNPGKFYALPQAPQQFKQLLMVSGLDKYFQIAPCFRDEDARADRSPTEFYQIDMEMAFATQEDIFIVMEGLFKGIFEQFAGVNIKTPFTRIKYEDAIRDYCSDKPDLRNPLKVVDVSEVFKNTEFNAFKGKTIKAIKAHTGKMPRSFYDKLVSFITSREGKGMAYLYLEEDLTFVGGISKFVTEEERKSLIKLMDINKEDSIFFIADEKDKAIKLTGALRGEIANSLGLIDDKAYEFCWVVDFPFYEINDEGQIEFSHNPFSMPQANIEQIEKDPLSVKAYQYDLVINGYESMSGAVRNHNPEMMVELFKFAGYDKSVVESKFPALYNAFSYGAPPHAGAGVGFDRIMMLLTHNDFIRDVIAFPMNKNACDPLTNAPTAVDDKLLKDIHIMLRPEE